jgi:hypothetical protein
VLDALLLATLSANAEKYRRHNSYGDQAIENQSDLAKCRSSRGSSYVWFIPALKLCNALEEFS